MRVLAGRWIRWPNKAFLSPRSLPKLIPIFCYLFTGVVGCNFLYWKWYYRVGLASPLWRVPDLITAAAIPHYLHNKRCCLQKHDYRIRIIGPSPRRTRWHSIALAPLKATLTSGISTSKATATIWASLAFKAEVTGAVLPQPLMGNTLLHLLLRC